MNEIEKVYENAHRRIDEEVSCEDCPFECDGTLPCYLVTMCVALQEKLKRTQPCKGCIYFDVPDNEYAPCQSCKRMVHVNDYFRLKEDQDK